MGRPGLHRSGRHLQPQAQHTPRPAWLVAVVASASAVAITGSVACSGIQPVASHRGLRARWALLPGRSEALETASQRGLFDICDRYAEGAALGDEELFWSREYSEDGTYKFWSLGSPKMELQRLAKSLSLQMADGKGLSAVLLGCGLGLDVEYMASLDPAASAVAGVDFALPAIKRARKAYGSSAGVFFHHANVCDLPRPVTPLDLVIDNTVFQNLCRSGSLDSYLAMLRRISLPGHTVLHLNVMSQEGIESRPEFAEGMEYLNLPLTRKEVICEALGEDWQLLECREGSYDLQPEAVGITCDAFYSFGSKEIPCIPSWCVLAVKK
eukprot:TRINITY_DN59485_c0_g1_i1.p1 TRINITY_DN59485_c0_g1~~TRINITY_DN59485_c0_g1_i1.p1  ORF type:complete len:326 (-),score=49.42 TRINITY_DN59485_c0_g1_i1:269-1246(-)